MNSVTVRFVEESSELEPALKLLSELNQATIEATRERFLLACTEGLKVVAAFDGPAMVAVATFRFCWRLYCGRTLYIDDFIAASPARFKGYGSTLFRWFIDHAKEEGCVNITLDTGVRVFGAHRFYHRHGMKITSHHMTLNFNEPSHYQYSP